MNTIDGSIVQLLGIHFSNLTKNEAILEIIRLTRGPAVGKYVVTPNVDHVVRFHKSDEFREIYEGASLVLADGMPVMWASALVGAGLKEKVSGSDLFESLCERAAAEKIRIFLLGGELGSAVKCADMLVKKFPEIIIAGTLCPDFGFEREAIENQKVIAAVRDAQTELLFVGLGSPKQERWLCQHGKQTGATVGIGIGVAFSFYSGMLRRAPLWMQKAGLEWAWRVAMEPKRLWKRYFIDDLPFFWLVARELYKVKIKRLFA